jgi:hypothetical protein
VKAPSTTQNRPQQRAGPPWPVLVAGAVVEVDEAVPAGRWSGLNGHRYQPEYRDLRLGTGASTVEA